jgi:hypothetical protein
MRWTASRKGRDPGKARYRRDQRGRAAQAALRDKPRGAQLVAQALSTVGSARAANDVATDVPDRTVSTDTSEAPAMNSPAPLQSAFRDRRRPCDASVACSQHSTSGE